MPAPPSTAEPVLLSFTLSTHAAPAAVWTVLSDTDRLNRLAGLAFEFSAPDPASPDSRGTGRQQHLGLTLRWQERPVVFTEPTDIRIERDYENGPVARVVNTLFLEPDGAGTRITYEVRLWPRNALLRPIVLGDVRLTVRPGLSRALNALVSSLDAARPVPDLPPPSLTPGAERVLKVRSRALHDRDAAAALIETLRSAPLHEQTTLAPRALARRWGMPVERVLTTLLEAEAVGLLQLEWSLDCPACRLPTPPTSKLSIGRRSAHCASCDLRFDAGVAFAIAVTFRPAPEVRRVLARPRCLSSPARTPHILAQRGLDAGAEVDWDLSLAPGSYRVRTLPELDVLTLVVSETAERAALTVLVGPKVIGPPAAWLRAGRIRLQVRSKCGERVTLRIERVEQDTERVTVGDVLSWPDVAARLPADALEAGVEIAPFEGWVMAVCIARGGAAAEARVVEALALVGARALQTATGWVTATFATPTALASACASIRGTHWLGAAIGHGWTLELAAKGDRMAAGPLLQGVLGLAARAAPGEILTLEPESWPPSATPVGFCPGEPMGPAGDRALVGPDTAEVPLLPLTPADRPLRPGDLVDERFKLGERVGEGGFGVVYEALDMRTGADVVVKLLRSVRAGDGDAAQRFYDEGRLAARLRGRNVVRIYEWGLAEDGRLFIAMERLSGRALSAVLRVVGVIDPVRTLRILAGALAGLAEAHANGLVHRDVKPGNLFIVDEGTPAEYVKLIDFGIALDRTGDVPSMDRKGVVVGTPAYVSPEQVLGRTPDGRSDLYALALVAHTCLAGSIPFVGETPIDLVHARVAEVPESLATRAPGPLPPGLSELVDATLARDPKERPASAAEMAARVVELQGALGDATPWIAAWANISRAAKPRDRIIDNTRPR